jgi:hypothetical protein
VGVQYHRSGDRARHELCESGLRHDQRRADRGGSRRHHHRRETWIISGLGGTNTINGKGGTGFIQKRGNAHDTIINAANYTKALR